MALRDRREPGRRRAGGAFLGPSAPPRLHPAIASAPLPSSSSRSARFCKGVMRAATMAKQVAEHRELVVLRQLTGRVGHVSGSRASARCAGLLRSRCSGRRSTARQGVTSAAPGAAGRRREATRPATRAPAVPCRPARASSAPGCGDRSESTCRSAPAGTELSETSGRAGRPSRTKPGRRSVPKVDAASRRDGQRTAERDQIVTRMRRGTSSSPGGVRRRRRAHARRVDPGRADAPAPRAPAARPAAQHLGRDLRPLRAAVWRKYELAVRSRHCAACQVGLGRVELARHRAPDGR